MNIRKHLSTRLAIRSLVVAVAAGVVPVAAATTSAEAAPYCGITWGSLAKSSATMVPGPVTNVRAGRHTCSLIRRGDTLKGSVDHLN
jgi:type IV secretory pathway VirB2 component (pilin)